MAQGSCDVIHLTSSILLLSCLISSDSDFVDFCHDSAIHASLMALAAPEVFAPPWARKFFLVGARISSLKLPLHLKCSGKGTTMALRFTNLPTKKYFFQK